MPERDSSMRNHHRSERHQCCKPTVCASQAERTRLANGAAHPLLLLLFLAIAWQAGLAQIQFATDPEYLIQLWQTDQGLPENSATAMVQTPDGYLWFGTFNGLVRFDGIRFTVFNRSNTPELPSPAIVNLYLDRGGRLWISTMLGMAYVKDGEWHTFRENSGWTGNYVWSFAESPSGQVYMTTFDHKILRFQNDRFEEIQPPAETDTRFGFEPYVDETGALWVINPRFIGKLVDGKWQETISALNLLKQDGAESERHPPLMAGTSRDGGLWIATQNYLRKYRSGRLVFETRAPWKMDNFWSLYEDASGGVWISSSRSGLYRASPDGRWRHFTTADGLSYYSVRFVFQDREGNWWVGTSGGGLERFKHRDWMNWGVAQGIPEQVVKSVSVLPHSAENPHAPRGVAQGSSGTRNVHDGILMGTWGQGAVRLEGTTVSTVLARGETQNENGSGDCHQFDGLTLATIVDHKGRIWVGSYSDGLYLLEGNTCRKFLDTAANNPSIYALFEDLEQRIWIGTEDAAFRFDNGQLTRFALQGAPRLSTVRSFAEDPRDHTIWAGNEAGGLYRLQGQQFVSVPEARELAEKQISSLLADRDGTLWIGTKDSGIGVLRNGHLSRIGQKQGLPTDGIASILDDGLGSLWFGSNRGILRATRLELEPVISGRQNRLTFQLFDLSDGLATLDCSMESQPASAKDRDGNLWFATFRGVATVNRRSLRLNAQPPPVMIEKVLVDGQPVGNGKPFMTSSNPPPISVTVPPGDHRLEIQYAGLSFTAPEKVHFSFMLEGIDPQWIDVGNRRVAYWEHMKPGRFRFHVIAANNDGIWNNAGTTVDLNFEPHIYQTYWFYALCILLPGLSGIGLHQMRTRQLRRRAQELSRMVDRQTRDLAKERTFLRHVLDSNPNYIFAKDREGRFTLANKALAEALNTTIDYLVGKTDLEILSDAAQAEAFRRDDLEVLRTMTEKIITEQISTNPDGSIRWVQTTKRPIIGEDGRADQVLGVATDITRRKQAEEELQAYKEKLEEQVMERSQALRTSQGLLHAIIDNSSAVIYVKNSEGRYLLINRRFEDLFHVKRESVLGKNDYEIFSKERAEVLRPVDQHVIAAGKTIELEEKFQQDDGLHSYISIKSPLHNERGETFAICGISTDITERKRLEERLRQAQRMEAIGTLSGGIAHDFNNLLTVIKGYSRLVLEHTLDQEIRSDIERIDEAAERAAILISQLLAFSRQQVLQPRVFSLNTLVLNLDKMLRRLIGEDIELKTVTAPDLGAVKADPSQVEQVIMNLVVNARDAMPQGGKLTLETANAELDEHYALEHAGALPGRYAMLAVSDTGIGMDADTQSHVFEPFFTTKELGRGTGLGLSTVYGIVKQSGGYIWVYSEVGRGSTFKIYLPWVDAPAEDVIDEQSSMESTMGTETILLVEDDHRVRELARAVLIACGYTVLVAENAQTGIVLCNRHSTPIHLLLTDVVMPDLSGRELARQIAALRPGIKVLYMSGYTTKALAHHGELDVATFLLSKPFTPGSLAAKVREILDQPLPQKSQP